MNSLAATLDPEETRAVLSAALNEVHGADARLEGWRDKVAGVIEAAQHAISEGAG